MAQPITPVFKWGAALEHQWLLPHAVDRPIPKPIDTSGFAEADSGFRDAWVGKDQFELTFEARFVPAFLKGSVTGFNDANGVQAALLYMKKNGGRFFPNKDDATVYHDVYLLEYEVDRDGGGPYYRIRIRLRDAGGNAFRSY